MTEKVCGRKFADDVRGICQRPKHDEAEIASMTSFVVDAEEQAEQADSTDGLQKKNIGRTEFQQSLSWLWQLICRNWRVGLLVISFLVFLVFAIWPLRNKSDTPEMVFVKAGSFIMSIDKLEGFEGHRVTLTKDYWIGKYEVTEQQYWKIMHRMPAKIERMRRWIQGNYPVSGVSWKEAMEYCRLLTERERKAGRLSEDYEYTLPTEAQWEYAARGGNLSKGYRYSGSDNLDEVGWYEGNRESVWWRDWFLHWSWQYKEFKIERTESRIQPVGRKLPNELGIYDMSGNMEELCMDCCSTDDDERTSDRYMYYESREVDPCARDMEAEKNGEPTHHVARGGSWFYHEDKCTTAYCGNDLAAPDVAMGFRVVIVPVQR